MAAERAIHRRPPGMTEMIVAHAGAGPSRPGGRPGPVRRGGSYGSGRLNVLVRNTATSARVTGLSGQ